MTIDLWQAEWRKASYSTGSNGACVEVALNLPGMVAIRDSKRPAGGEHVVSRVTFRALADTLRRTDGLGT